MEYTFTVESYSGFRASEREIKRFSSLQDCFKAHKKSSSYDYAYDDGTYSFTREIVFDYSHKTPAHKEHKRKPISVAPTIVLSEVRDFEFLNTSDKLFEDSLFDADEELFG